MIGGRENYINISDFTAFADAVDAFNSTLSDGKRLNIFYIPLRKHSKVPATSKPMYIFDESGKEVPRPTFVMSREKAENFLKEGLGNVGILAYSDGVNPSLVLFDFDIKKGMPEGQGETVIPKDVIAAFTRSVELPVVMTRQGGYHVFAVNDGSFTNGNLVYEGQHAGEVRAHKMYVVAAGSYVPKFTGDDEEKGKQPTPDATGCYKVIAARPFKYITQEDLPEGFGVELVGETSPRKPRPVQIRPLENVPSGNTLKNDLDVSLTEIRIRDKILDDLLLQGAVEKDRSKHDYKVAVRLANWGFDDSQIAHILKTFRSSEKTDRSDYIARTLSKISRKYDWKEYLNLLEEVTREQRVEERITRHLEDQVAERIENRSSLGDGYLTEDGVLHLKDFPSVLPETPTFIHVRGLPRIGKSHWTLVQLSNAETGIYVTANHDIIAQQFRTFHRLAPGKTKVWIKGKQRCCVHTDGEGKKYNCKDCPLRPRSKWDDDADPTRPTTEQVETAVSGILERDGYLCYLEEADTEQNPSDGAVVANVPRWVCPYHALHIAERDADFVFTIPYYTTTTDDLTSIRPRDLMVMDEDTVFKFYKPKTVSLLEYGFSGKSQENFVIRSHVSAWTDEVNTLRSTIEGKERQTAEDKIILTVVQMFSEIDRIVKSVTRGGQPVKFHHEIRKWIGNEIRALLMTQFDGLSTTDKKLALAALTNYMREISHNRDDDGVVEFAEALLFPYTDNHIFWAQGNPGTLYMVSDESRLIRQPTQAQRYLIVGFTEGELFAEQMSRMQFGNEWDSHILKMHIEKFPYGNNFLVYRICADSVAKQEKIMNRLIYRLNDADNQSPEKSPRLTLTSSKVHQLAAETRSNAMNAVAIRQKQDLATIRRFAGLNGAAMTFYANSRISRGIDVPFIDLIIADSCNFAQPYLDAVADALKRIIKEMEYDGRGDVEAKKRLFFKVIQTKNSLLTDETTNGVLRISPVIGSGEDQVKVIVIRQTDFTYVNDEATQKMTIVDVDEMSDLNFVVRSILSVPRKVNSDEAMLTLASMNPDVAGWLGLNTPRHTRSIGSGGCVKTLIPQIVEALAPINIVNIHKQEFDQKVVDLETKILDCPKFDNGGRLTKDSLKKWCNTRFGKLYHRDEIDRAIVQLINKKLITAFRDTRGKSPNGRLYEFVTLTQKEVTRKSPKT